MGTLALSAALAAAMGAAVAAPVAIPPIPNLEFSSKDVRVTPRTLPTQRSAPVSFSGAGRISTRDGSHPSALREALLQIDRNVAIDVEGLPACGYRRVAFRDGEEARRACRKAVVGSGEAAVELAYPENAAIRLTTEVTVFNAGVHGGATRLLIHGFLPIPVPHAVVARVEMRKEPDGRHAWLARIEIPKIGDGYGSLIDFRLSARRIFLHDGRKESFLSARCPNGRLRFSVPELMFRNESRVAGHAPRTVLGGGFVVRCTPRA